MGALFGLLISVVGCIKATERTIKLQGSTTVVRKGKVISNSYFLLSES